MYHVYTVLLMVHLHEVDMLLIYYHLCFLGGTKIIISLIIFLKQSLLAKAYSGFIEVYLGQHTDYYLPPISILRETSALNVKNSIDLYQQHPQSDS